MQVPVQASVGTVNLTVRWWVGGGGDLSDASKKLPEAGTPAKVPHLEEQELGPRLGHGNDVASHPFDACLL